MEEDLDRVLVKEYGTRIEKDLEVIKNKISAVIVAHTQFNKNISGNPWCSLNKTLDKILNL